MTVAFFATYIAVLGAEVVGDKLLYTIGVLAGRYSRLSIVAGTTAAFMFKMGAAVAVGAAITRLPRSIVLATTGASFLWIAWNVWRQHASETADPEARSALLLSFSAVVFSEWGDLGQLTAAAMAARFVQPLVVWIAAVLAMMTKSVLAMTVGARLRQWARGRMSDATLRYASVGLLLVLGTLSVAEVFSK